MQMDRNVVVCILYVEFSKYEKQDGEKIVKPFYRTLTQNVSIRRYMHCKWTVLKAPHPRRQKLCILLGSWLHWVWYVFESSFWQKNDTWYGGQQRLTIYRNIIQFNPNICISKNERYIHTNWVGERRGTRENLLLHTTRHKPNEIRSVRENLTPLRDKFV